MNLCLDNNLDHLKEKPGLKLESLVHATGKKDLKMELFKRSEKAIFSNVGGDVVALHVDRGQCYGMEKITATVWDLLSSPMSANDLCERLMQIYVVEPSECRSDIDELLGTMESEGLVERVVL
jgi:hypothetical protein